MPSSSNYNPGQRLGKLILIKEVDPHICPSGQIKRKALFKCDCGTEIEALVDNVKKSMTDQITLLEKAVKEAGYKRANPEVPLKSYSLEKRIQFYEQMLRMIKGKQRGSKQ